MGGVAVADLVVKDATGTNTTMFDFVCFTAKHCSTAVMINSAGTEIATVANPLRATETNSAAIVSSLGTLATSAQMSTLISTAGGPIPTGTNTIGNVVQVPSTAGACTPYHLAGGTAATNNAQNVKATPGILCEMTVINTTTTTYFLKLYDLAAAPTCSSATGLKHVYPILSTGGLQRTLNFGENYAVGIAYCVTGGGADTDNTNAATGVYVEAGYK
jgi:hypothetical protein